MRVIHSRKTNEEVKQASGINRTALLSWIGVFFFLTVFWVGAAIVYEKDYVPHTIAKLEHKEAKFMANHKMLSKKFFHFHSSLS